MRNVGSVTRDYAAWSNGKKMVDQTLTLLRNTLEPIER